MKNIALTFDDVTLIPQYSDLNSRSEVDLTADLGFASSRLPVISAAMDTVTGEKMLLSMFKQGCWGIHHRYCDIETLRLHRSSWPIAVSPSMGTKFIDELYEHETNVSPIVAIDVAHGDSKKALDYAEYCVKKGCVVMSGNIVTADAAYRYYNIGVNIFKVGVGPGSACTTRIVSGHGVPQITAIKEVRKELNFIARACFDQGTGNRKFFILSDGGCRTSGDVVKALAAGANAVISGSLFAGCDEVPVPYTTHYKKKKYPYRGMASREALSSAGKEINPEGVASWVEAKGPVKGVLDSLESGLRAGFAYSGARNIQELWEKARFVRQTPSGVVEGGARI